MSNILIIVAPVNFRDEECFIPKDIFEADGHTVKIASRGVNTAKSVFGKMLLVEIDNSKVNIDDYDAVILTGGIGAKDYFCDEVIKRIVLASVSLNKILGAICVAPMILANAGVLRGVKATVFEGYIEEIKKLGAVYQNENVVVSGNIITCSGPKHAEEFAYEVIKKLA